MGLWNTVRTWVLGVDLEQTQRDIDAADAGHARENQQAHDDGRWTDEQWNDWLQRRNDGQLDVEAEVSDAWWAGFNDAAKSMTAGIRNTLAFPVNFALRSLPWWVWVGGVLALLYYTGAWTWLRGIFARRLKA